MEQLAAISDGKWVESGPEMKKRICHLSFYIQTVVESFSGVQDEMYEVKKEIKEIKKVTAEVTQIKDKITQVSEQMMNLESKIDEKHNNIQGLVNTTMGALQNIETKLKNDEEEREKEKEERDKYRKDRENERIAFERNLIAPNLIVYGFKMVQGENTDSLFKEVEAFMMEILGLNKEDVSVHGVVRFGRPGGTTASTSSTSAPTRPPPIRIILRQPSMKGPLFKSLIRLKGKDEFKGLSIMNEITKAEMPAHKRAVERAQTIRRDTDCRVRVTMGKGPIALKVLFKGEWMLEDKFYKKLDKKEEA